MSIDEWYESRKEDIKRIYREEEIYEKEGKMCSNCGFKIDGICMSFGDCYRGNPDGTKDYWEKAEWVE